VRKLYQSHLLARDVDAVGNDGHGTGKATAFICDSKQLCTTVLFMLRHAFDLGLRPTNQTTQYDGSSRARHVTLYHTYPHRSTIKRLDKSQTQENWGLFAHQPPVGLPYPTICSTNNTKHRTQICTLVLSLVLSMSRHCGIGIGGHPGQQHRVHGTPDGDAMVMGADVQVTLLLMAAHDQRWCRCGRRQSVHLRQSRSCPGRRCRDGVECGEDVRNVLLRSVVSDLCRLQLLRVVLGKHVKPLTRHSYPSVTLQRQTYTRSEVRLPRVLAVSDKVAQLATPVTCDL